MTSWKRTHRNVDGERIEGTWRHVFIHNGPHYYLTDLAVYADGLIDCWGLVDIDGLREKLDSGWVSLKPEDGARLSVHDLADGTLHDVQPWVDGEMLLAEVADEIDRLNGRPDSTGRCMQALDEYLADRTEERRIALRDAYLAIPEHHRMYALGDQDAKDGPLAGLADDDATDAERESAFAYFAARERDRAEWEAGGERRRPDGPERAVSPTVYIGRLVRPPADPAEAGVESLQLGYPLPLRYEERTYPTLAHAYWALSTGDGEWHDRIAAAGRHTEARNLAADAPRREGWAVARLAVMADLLRAKCAQHEAVAEVLRGTGDGRIVYAGFGAPEYWTDGGANWVGRLLEVVRAELAAGEWDSTGV